MTPGIITKEERESKMAMGLGDAVKAVIHNGLEVAPLTEAAKDRIRKCSKCEKRRVWLNEMVPSLWRPFTG